MRKGRIVISLCWALAVAGCTQEAGPPAGEAAGNRRVAPEAPQEPQTKAGEVTLREVTLEVTGMS